MAKTAQFNSFDDLALLIKQGFDEVDQRFNVMHDEMHDMKQDINGLKLDMTSVHGSLATLEDGQNQIKLRLDNVTYRFEINDLERRVHTLEQHAGLTKV